MFLEEKFLIIYKECIVYNLNEKVIFMISREDFMTNPFVLLQSEIFLYIKTHFIRGRSRIILPYLNCPLF